MLTAVKPAFEDLWFREIMLKDEETMSFNHLWGGTIAFPKERWKDWYDFWVKNPDDRRYYRYLQESVDGFVGEIAYHYDPEIEGYLANVIIYSRFRRKGYGNEALDILCEEAKKKGIDTLYDDIASDNPAISLFLKHGFFEDGRAGDKIILKKKL